MRTAIFMGLSMVATAIRVDWIGKDASFLAILAIVLFIMDVLEFLHNLSKK